jgi:hypothetical protein
MSMNSLVEAVKSKEPATEAELTEVAHMAAKLGVEVNVPDQVLAGFTVDDAVRLAWDRAVELRTR